MANTSTAALARFLRELRTLEAKGDLDTRQRAQVHERMSNCYRWLGDMKRAEAYADSATVLALAVGDSRILAHAYCTRASAAIDQEQWASGYDHASKALAAYRDGAERESRRLPSPSFEAQALLMLAECSLHLRHISRARRLALAAKRIGEEHEMPLSLAYVELLLGRIEKAARREVRSRPVPRGSAPAPGTTWPSASDHRRRIAAKRRSP